MLISWCIHNPERNNPLKLGVPTRFCRYNLALRTLILLSTCPGFFIENLNIYIHGPTRDFRTALVCVIYLCYPDGYPSVRDSVPEGAGAPDTRAFG